MFKQYDAFEDMKVKTSKFKTIHNTVTKLKEDTMKARLWIKLLGKLKINIQFNDLTLLD